jgi:hypothetical protein
MFKANADHLDSQAGIHRRAAAFYRKAYNDLKNQGQNIVREFNSTDHHEEASSYQQWLNHLENLLNEATLHDGWAGYFTDLAAAVRRIEAQLTISG